MTTGCVSIWRRFGERSATAARAASESVRAHVLSTVANCRICAGVAGNCRMAAQAATGSLRAWLRAAAVRRVLQALRAFEANARAHQHGRPLRRDPGEPT